ELRKSLWAYVRKLNEKGTTVLLTTHYLEEAEELCDRIAIINHGMLVANDTKQNLLGRIDNKKICITVDCDLGEAPSGLRAQGWERTGVRQLSLAYKPSQKTVGQMLDEVRANGLQIVDLSTEETDLEDIFLQLTAACRKRLNR